MRKVETTLENILDLISCAQDYGFEDDVLFDAFSEMIDNTLTDEEIEVHARGLEQEEGYGEEDYEEVSEILKRFKNKYCK